jgi:hypothetical protein
MIKSRDKVLVHVYHIYKNICINFESVVIFLAYLIKHLNYNFSHATLMLSKS